MAVPKSAVSLRHMLEHAKEAASMAQGKKRIDLDTDRKLNLALVRLLEIIGEAASRIPKEERDRHPDIQWRAQTRFYVVTGIHDRCRERMYRTKLKQ